jgi:hypothetical protein
LKAGTVFSHHRLEVLIACHIRQIKVLDILQKRSILKFILTQFSLSVNFKHNPDLPEVTMIQHHPKVSEMKPPRETCTHVEAFSFWAFAQGKVIS